jgi:DNA invertase Pin-like site-specific DNA recombinase
MSGQHVGYIRVSAIDQRSDRQLDGVTLDRTFTDKASGKDVRRPELEAMVGFVRDGDTVVCHSMDRLARNLDDLRSIVRKLTAKGVQVHFVKEQLTFTGDDTAMANLLLSVMGAFAEFERSLIRERQREGIELAKKRGAYRGRRRSMNDDQVAELRRRADEGVPKAALARELGVSRETLYQYLRAASSGSGAAEKPPAAASV